MKQVIAITMIVALISSVQSCSNQDAGKDGGAADKIAAAHGIEEFSKIKSLEFTFNVDKDSTHMERHWKCFPSENRVVFYDKGDSVAFKRMDTSTAELKKLNAQFTNDEYWLLFPLHLKWDKGYTLSGGDTATGVMTNIAYRKYIIQYNDKDGFTPGDMYDLFVDDKNIVREWAFHKGGSKEPSLVTSWDSYEDFNGLKIAKDHRSPDGGFRMHFSGISVTH